MLVPEEQQRSARSPQPPAHLRSASPANALTEQLRRRRQLGRDGLARGDGPPPPEHAVDSYQPPSLILSFFLGLGLIYAVLSVLIWVYSRPYLALDALFGVAALFASGPVMRWLQTVVPRRPPETRNEPGEFGLWIGEATGAFASMGHLAGIQAGANITLNLPDAAKNIAIFGETGTGKTTRVINHLLVQALDFDCGALIFDVRGDFYATARAAAQLGGKTIQRIGVDALGLNLLDGLTPNTAAGFLESAFRLLGQGHGDSGFWLSLAVARCQNALGVLEHVPGAYSLKALYQFVFDERFRTQALETGARTA